MDHPDHALDAIDRRILEVMQLQGRITFDELAAQVQLSASAVLRRVRRLEEAGVITGYAAIVPPERLGLGLTALVDVRLAPPGEGSGPAERFRAAVQDWPEVVECLRLGDGMDFQLRVTVRDVADYGRFLDECLLSRPEVRDCRSRIVLAQVKSGRPAV